MTSPTAAKRASVGTQKLHIVLANMLAKLPLTADELDRLHDALTPAARTVLAMHPWRTERMFLEVYAIAQRSDMDKTRDVLLGTVPLTPAVIDYVIDHETDRDLRRRLLMVTGGLLTREQAQRLLDRVLADEGSPGWGPAERALAAHETTVAGLRRRCAQVLGVEALEELADRATALVKTAHEHEIWRLTRPHVRTTQSGVRWGSGTTREPVPTFGRSTPVHDLETEQVRPAAHWLHKQFGCRVDGWLLALSFASDNPTLGEIADVAVAVLGPAAGPVSAARRQRRARRGAVGRIRRLLSLA